MPDLRDLNFARLRPFLGSRRVVDLMLLVAQVAITRPEGFRTIEALAARLIERPRRVAKAASLSTRTSSRVTTDSRVKSPRQAS